MRTRAMILAFAVTAGTCLAPALPATAATGSIVRPAVTDTVPVPAGRAPAAGRGPRVPVPGGTALWVARFRGPGRYTLDHPAAVAVSPDGSRVFVTGSIATTAGVWNYATVAYDAASGTQLWMTRYRGLGYSDPASSAVSPDGSRVFVTGFTTPAGACCPDRVATVALDAATGRTLWTQLPFARGAGLGSSVLVSPDGSRVFVTGDVNGKLVTVADDAASGQSVWVARSSLSLVAGAQPSTALSSSGQTLFVAGVVRDASGNAFIMTAGRDASTGQTLWARLNRSGDRAPVHVAASPDGSAVYTATTTTDASGRPTILTLAFDGGTGQQLWARRYPAAGGSGANAIVVSPDGQRVYIAGYAGTSNPAAVDYATVAYDPVGHLVWARRYHATTSGGLPVRGAAALSVSPDGRQVYVTGDASGRAANSAVMATVGYDAESGQAAWVARYTGPRAYSAPVALAVSPDGQRLVVTGFSGASQGCCDIATIAYAP